MTAPGAPSVVAPFRDAGRVREAADAIRALAGRLDAPVRFMEVCGTHTMAVARAGLRALLPPKVRLVSGPGCPVCVTPSGYVAAACDLSRRPGVVIATFGDMVRVPGGGRSLEEERARGADVRVVYSPLDALAIARREAHREVVFLGVGFETTAPTVAAALLEARRDGLGNLSVLSAHKTMPAAMRALAADPSLSIDGFLCPGHVSAVTGLSIYRFLAESFGRPCAVAGFEPLDVLLGVEALVRMRVERRAAVENLYPRAVRDGGNPVARAAIDEVFEPCAAAWRGLGTIPGSGLRLREAFADLDAERRLDAVIPDLPDPAGCRCGDVLRGVAEPPDCPLFGAACAPDRPVGACMVSSEGACAAAFRFGGAA